MKEQIVDIAAEKKKRHINANVGQIIVWVGVLIYFLWVFAPFLIVIITSFTTEMEIVGSKQFVWFPNPLSTEGYRVLFELDPNRVNGIPSLFIGFINTLWQTLIPTVVGLIVSGLAAFCYAKYDFPGKKYFFAANLVLMTIPLSAGFADYLFYNSIGWTKGVASVLPLIIPKMFGGATTIFFIYPYIKALPSGIIEAAKIDGMGFFGIFFRIVFPLSLPIFLSQFLFLFVTGYNNYSSALIYLTNEKSLWTLQLALNQIVSYIVGPGGYANVQCAAALIALLPLIVLYCFCQKFFIEGMTAGSVKG